MTCAKRKVVAILFANNGHTYRGTNDCATPQEVCPRLPGEGYEKCISICHQRGHAETEALRQAGENARGSLVIVYNHDYCCDGCTIAMKAAGVARVEFSA